MRLYVNVLGLDNVPRVLPVDAPETITPSQLASTIQQQQRGRVLELLNPTQEDRQQFDQIAPLNLENIPLPSAGEQISGSAPTPPPPSGTVQPGRTPLSMVPPVLAGVGTGMALAPLGPAVAIPGAIAAAGGPGAIAGHYLQQYAQPQSPGIPLLSRMGLEARDQALGELLGYGLGKVIPQGLRSVGEGLQTRGKALEAAHTLPPAPRAPVITPVPRTAAGPTLLDVTGKPIASAAEQEALTAANRIEASNAKKRAAYETAKAAYQRGLAQQRLAGPGPGLGGGLLGINVKMSHAARPMQTAGRFMSMLPESQVAQGLGRIGIQGGLRARYAQPPDLTNPTQEPAF